jgi:hypothetical protein
VEIEELATVVAVAAAYLGHHVKHCLLHGFLIMKAIYELQEMASCVQRETAQSLLVLCLR